MEVPERRIPSIIVLVLVNRTRSSVMEALRCDKRPCMVIKVLVRRIVIKVLVRRIPYMACYFK